jgi:biopolymer transport protein ExbD
MAAKLHAESDDLPVNHDINVTPFIDVMLVLLIVFMVVAPLATVDVPVELPVSTAQPSRDDEPVFVTLDASHTISVGEVAVRGAGLGPALDKATKGNREARIFLRADRKIDYGALMELMDRMRSVGYLKVALVGLDTPDGGDGR